MSSAVQWFVYQNEEQLGPFDQDVLRNMASQGQLKPEDLIWRQGLDNWVPASVLKLIWQQPIASSTAKPEPTTATNTQPMGRVASVNADNMPVAIPVVGPRTETQWHYRRQGAEFGPVSQIELKKMIGAGILLADDHVRRTNQTNWRTVRELAPKSARTNPVQTQASGPKVALRDSSPYQTPVYSGYASEETDRYWTPRMAVVLVGCFVLGFIHVVGGIGYLNQYFSGSYGVPMDFPGASSFNRAMAGQARFQAFLALVFLGLGGTSLAAGVGLAMRKFFGWLFGLISAGLSLAFAFYFAWKIYEFYSAIRAVPQGFPGSSQMSSMAWSTTVWLLFVIALYLAFGIIVFMALLRAETAQQFQSTRRLA